jgi:hypothetical protein
MFCYRHVLLAQVLEAPVPPVVEEKQQPRKGKEIVPEFNGYECECESDFESDGYGLELEEEEEEEL